MQCRQQLRLRNIWMNLYPSGNYDHSRAPQNIKVRFFIHFRFLEFRLWLNHKLFEYVIKFEEVYFSSWHVDTLHYTIPVIAVVLRYCQRFRDSGNILVPLLVQELLFKWQYIAFFRAYLDAILKALVFSVNSLSILSSAENWQNLYEVAI